MILVETFPFSLGEMILALNGIGVSVDILLTTSPLFGIEVPPCSKILNINTKTHIIPIITRVMLPSPPIAKKFISSFLFSMIAIIINISPTIKIVPYRSCHSK